MRTLALKALLPAVLAVAALLPDVSVAQEPSDDAVFPAALVGTTWRLSAIDGRSPDPDLPLVRLNVRPARLEGSAGCNWYTAWLDRHGDGLAVSHLAATRRDCIHPRIMDLEARYLTYLENFRVYRWTGDALALMADTSEKDWLLFRRDPPHLNR